MYVLSPEPEPVHATHTLRSITMSCQHEASEGRAVTVIDAAPGDTAAAAGTRYRATGKLGIPVLIAPFDPQASRDGRGAAAAAAGGGASEMMAAGMAPFQGFLLLDGEEKDDPVAQRKKWFKEMRGWLMVLATVAASASYQAGLNPPGGVWQGGDGAGDPVLRDMHRSRYLTFYYFNATSFVTSLVIMVLLMNERFYHTEAKVVALILTTFVDLASLVGAYIAGSTRFTSTCVYVIVITCFSFVCVIYIGEGMTEICVFVMRKIGWMRHLANLRWFPVPAEVVRRASPEVEAEERRRRAAAPARGRRTFCLCCAASTTSDQKRDVEGQYL